MVTIQQENPQEVKRYDQRDALPYRSRLRQGTKEYDVYYGMRPELEQLDEKIRVHFDELAAHEVRQKLFPQSKLSTAWLLGTKKSVAYLLKDAIDGPVHTEKLEVDPAAISWKIKGLAKYLGAGRVGITRLNPRWVYSHHGYPYTDDWGKPIETVHQYAIIMAFPQTWDLWRSSSQAGIPNFTDEWHFYNIMAATAVRLALAIRSMGYPARAEIQSKYNCLLPPMAVDAGLGEQCRIGICLMKDYGLAFRLCAVTTDLPLVPDPPARLGIEDFCQKCTKCADNCPSGAISRDDKVEVDGMSVWKQDTYKCFRYWNAKGVSCSICRRACPWSKPQTWPHNVVANLSQHVPLLRRFIIQCDDVVYGRKPKQHPPPLWMCD